MLKKKGLSFREAGATWPCDPFEAHAQGIDGFGRREAVRQDRPNLKTGCGLTADVKVEKRKRASTGWGSWIE